MNRYRAVAAGTRAHQRLQETADVFGAYFSGCGYQPLRPQPPLPEGDDSILFTNSAMVPFKPLIRRPETISPNGGYLVQPCIRAHNLSKAFTAEFFPEFLLAFNMLGVIAPTNRLAQLGDDAAGFLAALGLTDGGLYRVLAADADLASAHGQLPIELDSRKPSYYRWSFGEPRMTGRGSTYVAPNAASGIRDLGNLIAFEWDGRTVAYGFGVGLESAQSCRDGVDKVVLLTPAGATLGPGSVPEVKYADLVGLMVRLLEAGVELSSRGQGHVARQAAFSAVRLGNQIGRGPADVVQDVIDVGAAQRISLQRDAAENYVSHFVAAGARDRARTAHLSFLIPHDVEESLVQESLDFDSDATVTDAHVRVIDRYTGPGLPPDTRSVTFAVDVVITPGTPLHEVLAAGAVRASEVGARLRGSLD